MARGRWAPVNSEQAKLRPNRDFNRNENTASREADINVSGQTGGNIHHEKVPLVELQIREYISIFLWLGLLCGLVAGVKVPLDISPGAVTISASKAPWVFGAIQWLLQRYPVWLGGWTIPLLAMAVLLSLPWWGKVLGRRWTTVIFLILSTVWVGLTLLYMLSG